MYRGLRGTCAPTLWDPGLSLLARLARKSLCSRAISPVQCYSLTLFHHYLTNSEANQFCQLAPQAKQILRVKWHAHVSYPLMGQKCAAVFILICHISDRAVMQFCVKSQSTTIWVKCEG